MERDRLKELHCIMPIVNVASVMQHGILSHRRAQAVAHDSVADPAIQARRAAVRVPGGRPLHEYANLYFDARNPMMYRRKERHEELAVLSISTVVLDLTGVVVTDRNASVDEDFVRFEPAPDGLAIVDEALTFAHYWTHEDYYEQIRRKQAKQAEVLVPDLGSTGVHPRRIRLVPGGAGCVGCPPYGMQDRSTS
jgi:ssDNA thymidine ADP-ribosyltransferase, DarT